jgi:2-alkyl-3-oxoalkanoate reductase
VVGRVLVPALLARGHQVAGLIRNPASAETVARMGAQPFLVDALYPDAVADCLQRFRPHAVTHQLTALPNTTDLRQFARVFEQTNRLRQEGLDILLAGSRRVGVKRFVAQSYCGWPFAREGGAVKSEEDRLDPHPPAALATTLAALQHVESVMEAASDVRGVALRYGAFYGAGTLISRSGKMASEIQRRRLPVIGSGGGVWSFLHVDDLTTATVAAIEGDATGIFNVVDDAPAPVAEWLPCLATCLGARQPIRIPAWLGRLLLPEHLFLMMTEIRGGSNAKFKRAFDWRPSYSSWREGFARGI